MSRRRQGVGVSRVSESGRGRARVPTCPAIIHGRRRLSGRTGSRGASGACGGGRTRLIYPIIWRMYKLAHVSMYGVGVMQRPGETRGRMPSGGRGGNCQRRSSYGRKTRMTPPWGSMASKGTTAHSSRQDTRSFTGSVVFGYVVGVAEGPSLAVAPPSRQVQADGWPVQRPRHPGVHMHHPSMGRDSRARCILGAGANQGPPPATERV